MPGLGTDAYGQAGGGLAEQLEQHDLLLDRLEHGLDGGVEVAAEPYEVGRATDGDALVGALVGEGLRQRRDDRGDDRADR